MTTIRSLAAAAALLILTAGCSGGDSAPGGPVDNDSLGVAIGSLPAPFRVAENAPGVLRLERPGDGGAATLSFQLGPEETNINLIEEVTARKEHFEGLADGQFFGNQELAAPIGTAFTARGAYTGADGSAVEEMWVFFVHPLAPRKLTLVYRYPGGGDSRARVEQLFEILTELGATTPTG